MTAAWAIPLFIVTLTFLVAIHELGHMIVAKRSGVKVEEFGIFMPPRIWAKQIGETTYSINSIPLGGFCKMLGEEDPSDPRSLAAQSAGTRLMILSAGCLVMLIFPIILFTCVYMVPHDVVIGAEGIEIATVVQDSPAYNAGMQKGDEVFSVNGTAVTTLSEFKQLTDANLGSEITIVVQRDAQQKELKMTPRKNPPVGQGALGIKLGYAKAITKTETEPPWTAARLGLEKTKDTIVAFKDGIWALASQEIPFEPGGVIAAGQATTEIAKKGWEQLAIWAGALSVALGLINLFPVPALDGGRIAFVVLEIIRRGKRISPQKEAMIHTIGFILLIAFMVFVAFQDVDRIIQGKSLLPE
ncbi:MAG: M50 family metallopeptidase [Dehalococcoidia bacterium]